MRSGLLATVFAITGVFLWGCPEPIPAPPSPGVSPSGVYVNIQVDAEGQNAQGLNDMIAELQARDMHTTVFVSGEFANANALAVSALARSGFEIALHGYKTGEQLATMTYEDQKTLLTNAKKAVQGCAPCGTYVPIVGFRPQFFSQNEDTYRILAELGFAWNSGFKAGIEPMIAGHEQDVAPYPVHGAGYDFYAVPISTVEFNGKRIYLCDMACVQAEKMTAEQWAQALDAGLTEALQAKRPLVVLLHGMITGDRTQYTYWQPFVDFLDKVLATNSAVVTTSQLVDLYKE